MDLILSILTWETVVGAVFGGLVILLYKPIFGIGKPRTLKDISMRGLENLGLSKDKALNEIRKRKKDGRYFPPYPNGWFVVIESDKLKTEGVEKVYYFGKELVIWRDGNGIAYVADGLSFMQYRNKDLENMNLNVWKSLERNGFVFVWYHKEGDEPTWEPPVAQETVTGYCHSRLETTMACHIQDVFENVADPGHFFSAHKSFFGNGQRLDSYFCPGWLLEHGKYKTWWKTVDTSGQKHMATACVNGTTELFGVTISSLGIAVIQYGPGVYYASYGEVVVVTAATPIEPFKVRMFNRSYSTTLSTRLFSFVLDKAIVNNLARDVCLFNRKIDVGNPPIVKEEKSLKNFRRWYSQFYSKWGEKCSEMEKVVDVNNNEI